MLACVICHVMSACVVGRVTSPFPYHWNNFSKPDSSGPAMYPSSDMLAPVVTLLMVSSCIVISTYNDSGVRDSSLMARLLVSCLVLAALAGCGGGSAAEMGTPPAPTLTEAVASDLQRTLHEMVEESGVPGASAAVVFADGSEWAGNAGNAVLDPRRPMTSQTALPFDSVTKVAVAVLTMRLVEQHKLALDDPISKWYPAWNGDPQAT